MEPVFLFWNSLLYGDWWAAGLEESQENILKTKFTIFPQQNEQNIRPANKVAFQKVSMDIGNVDMDHQKHGTRVIFNCLWMRHKALFYIICSGSNGN